MGVRCCHGMPGYRHSYYLWEGTPIVMLRGRRLRPSLINKYHVSSVFCDRARSSRIEQSTLPYACFSRNHLWYQCVSNNFNKRHDTSTTWGSGRAPSTILSLSNRAACIIPVWQAALSAVCGREVYQLLVGIRSSNHST